MCCTFLMFFFPSVASNYNSNSPCHLGPKGVINDWRRFKLESMDQDNLPPAKRDLLRQMSSPNGPKDDSRANLNRKVQPEPLWLWLESGYSILKVTQLFKLMILLSIKSVAHVCDCLLLSHIWGLDLHLALSLGFYLLLPSYHNSSLFYFNFFVNLLFSFLCLFLIFLYFLGAASIFVS